MLPDKYNSISVYDLFCLTFLLVIILCIDKLNCLMKFKLFIIFMIFNHWLIIVLFLVLIITQMHVIIVICKDL